MIAARHIFENPEELARHFAADVAAVLRKELPDKERAVLAVSGGTTPQLFFEALSREKLDWARVLVTLVDERQVDDTSPRSNARLVKANLIQNAAAKAQFVPLYQNPPAASLPSFDVAVLGMGNDGHTASFFPGGDTLAEVLSPDSPPLVDLTAPGSGEPRVTFSLQRLLNAGKLCLHIQGQDKMETLEKALGPGDVMAMPIRAVLRSDKPLDLYWCP
jgi:6-phosphogluconolactonase